MTRPLVTITILPRAILLRTRNSRGETVGMAQPLFHTADMVRDLTDETRHWPRYETVHGELLATPAPRIWHQEIVLRLPVALTGYLAREPVGHAFMSPSDISWGPDTLVRPDI